MRKLLVLAVVATSTVAFGATWKNVTLVDQMCSRRVKADPDSHPRECAMKCADSGYGILTSDGKFLKFDKKGNEQALQMLKSSDKKDHLRVNVEGEQSADQIAVKSISWQ